MYENSVWSIVEEPEHVWRWWLYKNSLVYILKFTCDPQCFLKNKKESSLGSVLLFPVDLYLRIRNVTKLNATKLKTVTLINVCKHSTNHVRYKNVFSCYYSLKNLQIFDYSSLNNYKIDVWSCMPLMYVTPKRLLECHKQRPDRNLWIYQCLTCFTCQRHQYCVWKA